MGNLFQSDIEKLLILSKMDFLHKIGLARPCARLPFRVGHHVCLGPTGDANVASPAVF